MPEPLDREYALNDVTLTVHRGETVSVIGPSGCGKTTLLRVIAGLTPPTSGEVLYDGQPVGDVPIAVQNEADLVVVGNRRRGKLELGNGETPVNCHGYRP